MNVKTSARIPALTDRARDRFDATVIQVQNREVLLDLSFFYPDVSAQPCDQGVARWDDDESAVERVALRGGQLWHSFSGPLPPVGARIHCEIDWPRRQLMSRLHTAAVLVAGMAHSHWHCDVSSCSLSAERVRLDFTCARKAKQEVTDLLARCNEAIAQGAEVTWRWIPVRRAAEHVSFYRSAATMRRVQRQPGRVVQIGVNGRTLEQQFDIGTHVSNIRELGELRLGTLSDPARKALENKGRDHFRIRFHLIKS
jgi:Ser-tRNA(Ala) deacylase AlaX